MKFYSKKVNRGLLLGGVCLIVLIFYLIAEQIYFTGEKEQIQSVMEDYLEKVEQLNESAVSFNEALPLLETYWSTGSTSLSCSWTNMAMALHTLFSSNRCEIDKTESSAGQYRIVQNGTNRATVECTYSLTTDIQEAGTYLLICQSVSLQEMIETKSESLYRWSSTIKVTADMIYEKHKWMIVGIDTSVLEQNIQPISE